MNKNAFTNDQVETLIRGIVQAIPGATLTLDADKKPHGFTQVGAIKVWFGYDSHAHRLTVHASWPTYNNATIGPWELNPRPEDPTITVSASKSPDTIAADISRRFMPRYLDVLSRCLEVFNKRRAYNERQQSLTANVQAALGYEPWGAKATSFDLPPNLKDASAYGDVEISGDTVRVHVNSLNEERALKLIAFLKTL